MSVFFIADTHFGHENILRFCNRPFNNAAEMDACIYDNWSAVVGQNDTVYHLGDVVFRDREKVLETITRIRKLPGKKYLIPGNHDWRYPGMLSDAFAEVLPPIFETSIPIKHGSQGVVLCHYPIMSWNGLYKGTIQLYGHVHGRIPGNNRQVDVGVDNWEFSPVRMETILQHLSTLPDFINPEIGMPNGDEDA